MSAETNKEIIETPKHIIEVNRGKLAEIKEMYGITEWDYIFIPNVTFLPNRVNWNDKIITIRPFNIWSYVAVGTSISKRNKNSSKLLAHETRHALQTPPDDSFIGHVKSARYVYWFHPAEIDARKWSEEHREEFEDIVEINTKTKKD